jgi:hypothetical protein
VAKLRGNICAGRCFQLVKQISQLLCLVGGSTSLVVDASKNLVLMIPLKSNQSKIHIHFLVISNISNRKGPCDRPVSAKS